MNDTFRTMKRRAPLLLFLLACAFQPGRAMEPGRLNIKTPSGLERGQAGLVFEHRLPLSFRSANTRIGLRYPVWRALELGAEFQQYSWSPRDNALNEATVAAGYSYSVPKRFKAEADVQFFSYQKPEFARRRQNVFVLLSAIPVVGLCFRIVIGLVGIYILVLEIMAVKGVNAFGWGPAVGAVLIPVAAILLICCCAAAIVGALTGAAIGNIFSSINSSLAP